MITPMEFMASMRIVELLDQRDKLTDLQERYGADDTTFRAIRMRLTAIDDELIVQRALLASIPER